MCSGRQRGRFCLPSKLRFDAILWKMPASAALKALSPSGTAPTVTADILRARDPPISMSGDDPKTGYRVMGYRAARPHRNGWSLVLFGDARPGLNFGLRRPTNDRLSPTYHRDLIRPNGANYETWSKSYCIPSMSTHCPTRAIVWCHSSLSSVIGRSRMRLPVAL